MPLSKVGLQDLLATYREAARIHGAATESGNHRACNKVADELAAVFSELRRRGKQRELLPLLANEDAGVRLWAAAHALEFSPADGEPVLRALVPIGRLIGLSAKATLSEWEAGRLRFP